MKYEYNENYLHESRIEGNNFDGKIRSQEEPHIDRHTDYYNEHTLNIHCLTRIKIGNTSNRMVRDVLRKMRDYRTERRTNRVGERSIRDAVYFSTEVCSKHRGARLSLQRRCEDDMCHKLFDPSFVRMDIRALDMEMARLNIRNLSVESDNC